MSAEGGMFATHRPADVDEARDAAGQSSLAALELVKRISNHLAEPALLPLVMELLHESFAAGYYAGLADPLATEGPGGLV